MSGASKPGPDTAAAFAKDGRAHLVYLLPALAYGLWMSVAPLASPLMDVDTASYLEFDNSRTAGYPYFLWAVEGLTGAPCISRSGSTRHRSRRWAGPF